MNPNQTELNNRYREVLKVVFGTEITLADKYLNSKAVIKHHCKTCGRTFFSRPQWLVNGKDPHECYFNTLESSSGKPKSKKATGVKVTGTKQSNYKPGKVTEEMKAEMILLYKSGESLKSIGRRFSVTPPTVKRHIS